MTVRWSIAAYAGTLLVAAAVAATLRVSEHAVNNVLMFADSGGGYTYSDRANLRDVMEAGGNPRIIARVVSPSPAMYLVGRCYSHYDASYAVWTTGEANLPAPRVEGSPLQRLMPEGNLFGLHGQVDASFEPKVVDRIESTAELHGTLFVPRDGVVLAANLLTVGRDWANVVYLPAETGYQGEYVVARGNVPEDPTPLTEEMYRMCVQVPAHAFDLVHGLALAVTRDDHSDLQRARSIEQYMQANYKYATTYHLTPGSPLTSFLQDHTPAHCELFATSMTLMLRSLGIPARYVVGFIVVEHNAVGDYWVVRAAAAHAWVEAWIEGHGWIAFDPTPPDNRPQASQQSLWSQRMDVLFHKLDQLKDWIAHVSWRALLALLSTVTQAIGRWLIDSPLRLALIIGLLGWELLFRRRDGAGRRWLQRWRARRARAVLADPSLAHLHDLMRQFDDLVERAGHPRPSALTLHEYADLLRDTEWAPRAAAVDFLETYAASRYGSPRPSAEQLQHMESICDQLYQAVKPRRR